MAPTLSLIQLPPQYPFHCFLSVDSTLSKFNVALLAKQFWRLAQSPNSLWARVMKSIYFHNGDVWDATVPRCCSWSWKSLLIGRDFLKRHRSWIIGNGRSVRIEGDRWVKDGQRIFTGNVATADLRESEIINQESKCWDVRKINNFFPPVIARDILAVPIDAYSMNDRYIWPHTKDGNYSVKTGYFALTCESTATIPSSSSDHSVDKPLWNIVWSAKVSPKIRTFIWRLCNNALASASNLHRRNIIQDNKCCICGAHEETVVHIFRDCSWVRAYWFGSIFQWVLDGNPEIHMKDWVFSRIDVLKHAKGDFAEKISCFFYHLWTVWVCRNKFLFERKKVDPVMALESANFLFNEFWSINVGVTSVEPTEPSLSNTSCRWCPPPDGSLKFNVDAALDVNNCMAAVGVIVRDSSGAMLTGITRRFHCDSVDRAEAEAMLEAVRFATTLGVRKPLFEGDNLAVVNACNGQASPWQADVVVTIIRELINDFDSVEFNWVPRSCNAVADWVARAALKLTLTSIWSWIPPVDLRALILQDRLVFRAT